MTAVTAESAFAHAFASEECRVVSVDGRSSRLPVEDWTRTADAADLALLSHCAGPTVDLGCGPGRMTAALAARGTIQEIVSSPLTRCRQTAETVAARLGLSVRIEEGLRETDFGAWEGLTFAEVRERHAEDLDAWLASPKAEPTGGGESFATVARRVAATRDRLTAAHAGRTVLLVTHVTPIKTLIRLALGAPPESLFRMELSAASLSAVAYYADGNASVRLLNDTAHLR